MCDVRNDHGFVLFDLLTLGFPEAALLRWLVLFNSFFASWRAAGKS
jgi:hypothetical protein